MYHSSQFHDCWNICSIRMVQSGETVWAWFKLVTVVKLVTVFPERRCGEALPQRTLSCLDRILKTLTRFRKRSLVKPPLQLKAHAQRQLVKRHMCLSTHIKIHVKVPELMWKENPKHLCRTMLLAVFYLSKNC